MDVMDRAERTSRVRATLFYMMAAAVTASTVIGLGQPQTASRIGTWTVLVALMALNLTPVGTMLRCGRIARLLNDEGTQAHRQASFVAGFWAAIVAGAAVTVVAAIIPLRGADVGRVVVAAALSAALVSFATQELRASR